MSLVESATTPGPAEVVGAPTPTPARIPAPGTTPPGAAPARRPLSRVVMHAVRRAHLYLGLFLLPWAILYGVTAFLFNHPAAFSDQPSRHFGPDALEGTPLRSPPAPEEVARQVVEALRRRAGPAGGVGPAYALASPAEARYTREFAFATATAPGGAQTSLLFDVSGAGGTLRAQPTAPKKSGPAPFAVGRSAQAGPGGGRGRGGPRGEGSRPGGEGGIQLPDPLHERVKAAAPVVLERAGLDAGEVTVTSVPDLAFRMEADGDTWVVTYNSLTGTVAGQRAAEVERPGLSVRRFLTRLHLAHGYPSSVARWFWAVVVDAMAFVMLFWGFSGLFMWWQIRATRWWGLLTLAASALAATSLGCAMHLALTA